MDRKKEFLRIFRKAEKKYKESAKRLAGEGWDKPWKVVLVTILSAQNRDEVTIPVAERFFLKFDTLEKIAGAHINAIRKYLGSINYFENKSKYVKKSARILLERFRGEVPNDIDKLMELPGVGRKTSNLVLDEIHGMDTITVDTHVHRISNVFGLVKTKNANETELALQKIVPKRYWSKINRIFVLWGKDVPGWDRERLWKRIEE